MGSTPGKLLKRYLSGLAAETNYLPWAHVDPEQADPKRGKGPSLTDIYTALDTTELERPMKSEDEVRDYLNQHVYFGRVSAQTILNNRNRLVLLGDPGSGKSTFINFITHIMSQAGVSRNPEKWLDRLHQTGPWKHDVLLPVRIILRLIDYLNQFHKEFWSYLADCLADKKIFCLVLLDGLDEVPANLRKTVTQIIEAFIQRYPENRYLVTCLPQRKVNLFQYAISKYPVTVAQFRAFAKDTKRILDDKWKKWNMYDNHPVVEVSWYDAVAYCEWLPAKLRERGLNWIIQLPTEAQWEKAA